MTDKSAREALAELVACDDEAERIENEGKVPAWDGLRSLDARYKAAWANARAALATAPAEPPKDVAALIEELTREWALFSVRDRGVIRLAKLLKQAADALARLSAPWSDEMVREFAKCRSDLCAANAEIARLSAPVPAREQELEVALKELLHYINGPMAITNPDVKRIVLTALREPGYPPPAADK